eukprot:CAMPEP_0204008698 /NCGR_PEP_ID=MMETSP0360-20130528/21330_1 /ASSEMBLY_ACC=CAM_ASM_000342 /TAXON_ID=268821 /ORGANISM="Scrippsiella Hangoei, Strain SHTV-5" /LENGTH=47 /DNA_ID= /DNA_START= /DNA_END= /DNA_ORIENTATION=
MNEPLAALNSKTVQTIDLEPWIAKGLTATASGDNSGSALRGSAAHSK